MKLYFLKQKALDYMRANIKTIYVNYYREESNQWIYELFDYDPFEEFIDVPDFNAAWTPDKKGEMDLENCKIFYKNLMSLSESQASDERLWAGLCHSVFYKFVRKRWNYANLPLKGDSKDSSEILSRFFFSGGIRSGCYRNTLAKFWWVGKITFRADRKNNYELLDLLGPEDFYTKVNDLFYNYTFSSNATIVNGVCEAWKVFKEQGIKLVVRDHFRPALQQLNALGGAILLDILSEEEVKDIFFDLLYATYDEKEPTEIKFDVEEEQENADVEISEDIQILRENNSVNSQEGIVEDVGISIVGEKVTSDNDSQKIAKLKGAPEKVMYGCTVIVCKLDDGKKICYHYPKTKSERKLSMLETLMLGKTVGEIVNLGHQHQYKIEYIKW